MTKQELRQKYKGFRQKMTDTEIEDQSIAIANQLLVLDIWNFSFYHIFLPIEAQKEVNTEYILQVLQGKDKNVVISKSNFEDGTLDHFLLTDQTKLVVNKYGIPEPENGIPISESEIEVVFVPLLAYDQKGNRVGYGKGFYDRFLNGCQPKKVIGVSFFPPEEHVDSEPHDRALDLCVTGDAVFGFNG